MGLALTEQLAATVPHSTPYSTGTLLRGLMWTQVAGNHLMVGNPSVFEDWMQSAPDGTIAGFIRFMLENKLGYLSGYRRKTPRPKKEKPPRRPREPKARKPRAARSTEHVLEEFRNAVLDLATYHPREHKSIYNAAMGSFVKAQRELARRGVPYSKSSGWAADFFKRVWPNMASDEFIQRTWGRSRVTLNLHYNDVLELLDETRKTYRDVNKALQAEAEKNRRWESRRTEAARKAAQRRESWERAQRVDLGKRAYSAQPKPKKKKPSSADQERVAKERKRRRRQVEQWDAEIRSYEDNAE